VSANVNCLNSCLRAGIETSCDASSTSVQTAFAYIVQWEANRAQTSGTPIFVFGKDMKYAEVLERMAGVLSKPGERIPLPMPLRWEPPPAPEKSGLRRYAWAAILAGVVGALLWLVLLLHLLTPVPEPAQTPVDASPALPLEASATTQTGEPVIAMSSPLLFTSTDPTAPPSS
jgi:hypothetical protein